MAQASTVIEAAPINGSGEMVQHVFAIDSIEIINRVRLRLKIDPEDGSVIHRDVDLDINWDEINALEARMLASRDA